MIAPKECYVNAPCKINLHLRVREKRPDGFHELESLFVTLAFGDSLHFEIAGEAGDWELRVSQPGRCHSPVLAPTGENLVSRAVALFRARTGFRQGLRCGLEKRVPLGAGLGGGSSDAASTLLALNLLAGTGLSREELLEMAALLGSDVPFFLWGGAAWAKGRGEILERLPPPGDYSVLLVKPPFGSATPKAFRLLDEYREKAAGPAKISAKTPEVDKKPCEPWECGSPLELSPGEFKNAWPGSPREWPFFNDFLPVLPESGTYRKILAGLREEGALFSGLSGSGSCCFGVFEGPIKALAAENAIKSKENLQNFTQTTFFLASGANPVLEL